MQTYCFRFNFVFVTVIIFGQMVPSSSARPTRGLTFARLSFPLERPLVVARSRLPDWTSYADGTEIMGGDGSVSNAAAQDCQMLVRHSGDGEATGENETETGLVILLLAMPSGGTTVGLFKRHDMELSATALNSTVVDMWYGRWVSVWLMGQGR